MAFKTSFKDQAQCYVTNHFYLPTFTAGNVSSRAISADTMLYNGPFRARENTVITRLGVSVDTGTGGSDSAILGIYTSVNGLPVELVGTNNATVSIQNAGQPEATVSIALTEGRLYWMVLNCDTGFTVDTFANTNNVRDTGGTTFDGKTPTIEDSVTFPATLPATSAATASDYTEAAAPYIWFRVV